jgi:hypothetical protein
MDTSLWATKVAAPFGLLPTKQGARRREIANTFHGALATFRPPFAAGKIEKRQEVVPEALLFSIELFRQSWY